MRVKKKVLVAMSGGVDSSVCAGLLKDEGYEVVGCFMRLGSPGESLEEDCKIDLNPSAKTKSLKIGHQGCCSINDAKDAQIVAAKLDIPLYILNFKNAFGQIINYFVDEYNNGRTPNPCVRCNDWLKFGRLLDYANSIDADYVATGHYARIEHVNGQLSLLRGIDQSKDQSYVLFGQKRERLERMLLPVGGFIKPDIRKMAEEMDLPVFNKPDSQEICFVPDNDYAGLIERKSPEKVSPGKIEDLSGNEVGEHAGQQHFTVGQRRGIGVALGYPIYVVNKHAGENTITVGPKDALYTNGLIADQVNWLVDAVDKPVQCLVKIRYNADPVPAELSLIQNAQGENELHVTFDEPQFAVAPGQAVVCYDGDLVMGGGWIRESVNN